MPRQTRSNPVKLPGRFGFIAERIADAFRFRDRQRTLRASKAQLAQEHLSQIRFTALTLSTKKGLIAHLKGYATSELSADILGELLIDLQSDIQFASHLRDGKAIRAFLRRRLV